MASLVFAGILFVARKVGQPSPVPTSKPADVSTVVIAGRDVASAPPDDVGSNLLSEPLSTPPDAHAPGPFRTWVSITLMGWGVLGWALDYYLADRGHAELVYPLFWLGAAFVLAGVVLPLVGDHYTDNERLLVAVCLGFATYAPKLLRSPHIFSFYDEFSHWLAVHEMLTQSGLFHVNDLNAVVEYFPGLALVTAELSKSAGLSIFAAGNIVMCAAHVGTCVAAYVIGRRLTGSSRGALLTTMVFSSNPAFFFFDTQFSYESLALLLFAAWMALVLGLAGRPVERYVGSVILALSLAMTHHVSALAIVICGGLVCLILAPRRDRSDAVCLVAAWLTASALCIGWIQGVAPQTWGYLAPDVRANLDAVVQFVRGSRHTRALYAGVLTTPLYERIGSYVGVILLTLTFAVGARRALIRRASELGREQLAAAVIGVAFFASIPSVWLQTAEASDAAKRTWEFAFVALAPIAALGTMAAFSKWPLGRRSWAAVLFAALVVTWMFGVSARSGPDVRFPGPFVQAADPPRALTADLLAAERFLLKSVGPDHAVVGDRVSSAVFGSYGGQVPITTQFQGAAPWRIFFPTRLTCGVFAELRSDRAEFLVIDLRDTRALPATGFYYAESEPHASRRTRPLGLGGQTKFHGQAFRTIFSGGDIQIIQYLPELGPQCTAL